MRFAALLYLTLLATVSSVGPTLLSSFLDDSTPFLRTRNTYPRYEVVDDEEKFQVACDVQGVRMEELHVSLEKGGTALFVSGHREVSDENYSFTSTFSQSFSLDSSVQVDKLVATVKDGVLVCSAPKDKAKMRETSRLIPIANFDTIEPSEPVKETIAEPIKEEAEEIVKQKVLGGEKDMHLTAEDVAKSTSEILSHWQQELRI